MLSVKGTFEDGVARPEEPVEGHDGQQVIITFVDQPRPEPAPEEVEAGWGRIMELVEKYAVDTGIPDLAHQHDHYLHGTPKRA